MKETLFFSYLIEALLALSIPFDSIVKSFGFSDDIEFRRHLLTELVPLVMQLDLAEDVLMYELSEDLSVELMDIESGACSVDYQAIIERVMFSYKEVCRMMNNRMNYLPDSVHMAMSIAAQGEQITRIHTQYKASDPTSPSMLNVVTYGIRNKSQVFHVLRNGREAFAFETRQMKNYSLRVAIEQAREILDEV